MTELNLDLDEKIYINTNEDGYEFYLSKTLTQYAHTRDLKDINVLYVKQKDQKNFESIIIVKDGVPIKESPSFEAIATHIDILEFLEGKK